MSNEDTDSQKRGEDVIIRSQDKNEAQGALDTSNIWPQERDVLSRPERLKYVRKLVKPEGCVFCAAHKSGVSAESLVLFDNDVSMVVLNKYPYNNGHLLVLPARHCGRLQDLERTEFLQINDLILQATNALQGGYGCAGLNIGLNQGAVAGAGIPDHMHWHLIPRWVGDTNFFPLIGETKVIAETLEQTYERLIPYFEGLKL